MLNYEKTENLEPNLSGEIVERQDKLIVLQTPNIRPNQSLIRQDVLNTEVLLLTYTEKYKKIKRAASPINYESLDSGDEEFEGGPRFRLQPIDPSLNL